MRNILVLIFFYISLFSAKAGVFPEDSTEITRFQRSFIKNFYLPTAEAYTCKPSVISIAVCFKEKRIEKILYSENCSAALIEVLKKEHTVYQQTNWEKIFPAIKEEKEYVIVLPIVYYFDKTCGTTTPMNVFAELSKGLIIPGLKDEVYMLSPIEFTIRKPVS